MKQCKKCKHFRPETEFFKNGYRRKDGTSATRNECKKCNKKAHDKYVDSNRENLNQYMNERYHSGDKVKIRAYGLKKNYGLSLSEYQRMFDDQEGKCLLCQKHQTEFKRTFDVDHCHATGKIRGLLCIRCNRGIGLLQDDVEILKRAIIHLEKNKN